MDLLIFILSGASLTVLLARGDIFDGIKYAILLRLPKCIESHAENLLYCPTCIGFWVGICLSVVMINPIVTTLYCLDNILAGAVISISASWVDKLIFKTKDRDTDV